MFYKRFLFHKEKEAVEAVYVTAEDLYSPDRGYGFVIEGNREQQNELMISELNTGFEPYYWLKGLKLTKLKGCDNGVVIAEGKQLPLIFKADVPHQGNYTIKVTVTAGAEGMRDLIIMMGRRRLMARQKELLPNQSYTAQATVNICDIIPRGSTGRYKDTTLDVSILSDHPVITELTVEEVTCPTLYIAGDSTVTDQGCSYPYDPGCSYSGWGQMLSYYLKPGIAVSNHSHSGLTTESFRNEGHYSIVEELIKPGDYFLMQFAHNDQKLPHLTAAGGYRDNLMRYVNEIRAKNAFPVIVTPIARNTWKSDGSYNDLLEEFADVCKEIGRSLQVPVIDLHGNSMDFVIREGLEEAAKYFYPKDYTHTNDYGAYLMAGYVAEGCCELEALRKYIIRLGNTGGMSLPGNSARTDVFIKSGTRLLCRTDWLPPESIIVPVPPPEFQSELRSTFDVNFTDIEELLYKKEIIALAKAGIIRNEKSQFCGLEPVTRIEALDWIVKAVRFVPMNVYNDRYPDVIGHEWYAGIVETVVQNGMVRDELTKDGKFHPKKKVTALEMTSFCMISYRCRKLVKNKPKDITMPGVASWAKDDINIAFHLDFIPEDFDPQKELTRQEAAVYVKKLMDLLI